MSEFKDGVPVSKSYGQMLTGYHEQIISQLSNNKTTLEDVSPLYDYLKLLRKMRPEKSGLDFIDELNLKICTTP
jgi:hypothetical protein